MAISFDKALGIHEDALELRVKRAELMANNLVNADTPGYKARDIDFKAVLAEPANSLDNKLKMTATASGHISNRQDSFEADVQYRIPHQPSLDGNTVEYQKELAEFSKNVLDYQASFQFLNSKFKGLTKALKGE